ncbi:hypothetical protein APHAL10511_002362 [Amanita phalloides]|nr:hypothetical protein APHAL10511_002362 [Amanita phalloides]
MPSWPSLYDPSLELLNIPHNPALQPAAAYLNHPLDVFRFTLYWFLIFYCPVFFLCGAYAFWNINFPPAPRPFPLRPHPEESGNNNNDQLERDTYPLNPLSPLSRPAAAIPDLAPPPPQSIPKRKRKYKYKYQYKDRERQSRFTFALLILLIFLTASLAGAVLASAIVGFVAAAFYTSVHFNMSTWIPFLLALITVLVGFLRSAPRSILVEIDCG